MLKPGLLSVLTPIAVTLFFRQLGIYTNQPLLGPQAICSFLMFSNYYFLTNLEPYPGKNPGILLLKVY